MGGTIAPKSFVHPEENVLRQVFGLCTIAGKPIANVEDAARMAAHKFLPGRTVALEALLDQLGILLQLFNGLETALWSIVPPLRLRLRAIAHRLLPQMEPLALDRCNPWTACIS